MRIRERINKKKQGEGGKKRNTNLVKQFKGDNSFPSF